MRILATLALALAVGPAAASVITFDSYQPMYEYTSTLSTGGFVFTSSCDCLGVDDQVPQDLSGNPLPGAFNGTASLLYSRDPLTMAAEGGAAFFLNQLDLGLSWYVPDSDVGMRILVTLRLAAGGTEVVGADLDRSYSTLEVNREVVGVSISGGRGFGYITLDNLVVNDNQVPEPASAGLALLALVSAGAAVRRRPQASA